MAAVAGDTERARELWQDFLDEHPKHMLGAEVRLNLYALDRAAGNAEAVAAELQAMLEAEDRPLPEDVVLHELAVTLESLGRDEEAAEHYQTLVSVHPQSAYATAARQKTGGSGPLLGLGS
jgi:tetratricopeptide (TPR) repeat protein